MKKGDRLSRMYSECARLIEKERDRHDNSDDYIFTPLIYALLQPGEKLDGKPIQICPRCGLPGYVFQGDGYVHETTHAEMVGTYLPTGKSAGKFVDWCKLDTGKPYPDGWPDEIRDCESFYLRS